MEFASEWQWVVEEIILEREAGELQIRRNERRMTVLFSPFNLCFMRAGGCIEYVSNPAKTTEWQ